MTDIFLVLLLTPKRPGRRQLAFDLDVPVEDPEWEAG